MKMPAWTSGLLLNSFRPACFAALSRYMAGRRFPPAPGPLPHGKVCEVRMERCGPNAFSRGFRVRFGRFWSDLTRFDRFCCGKCRLRSLVFALSGLRRLPAPAIFSNAGILRWTCHEKCLKCLRSLAEMVDLSRNTPKVSRSRTEMWHLERKSLK